MLRQQTDFKDRGKFTTEATNTEFKVDLDDIDSEKDYDLEGQIWAELLECHAFDQIEMNRDFVYDHPRRPSSWTRAAGTLNRWLWGALCCGVPGIPCYFCTCCEKLDDMGERDRPSVNQSTATTERLSRPHRPHAPRGRKSTPEMLSAVRCALSQLQGEPAPSPPDSSGEAGKMKPEPG